MEHQREQPLAYLSPLKFAHILMSPLTLWPLHLGSSKLPIFALWLFNKNSLSLWLILLHSIILSVGLLDVCNQYCTNYYNNDEVYIYLLEAYPLMVTSANQISTDAGRAFVDPWALTTSSSQIIPDVVKIGYMNFGSTCNTIFIILNHSSSFLNVGYHGHNTNPPSPGLRLEMFLGCMA